jgi:hypothetical protein
VAASSDSNSLVSSRRRTSSGFQFLEKGIHVLAPGDRVDEDDYLRVSKVTADFACQRFHGRIPRETPWYADEDLRQEAKFILKLAR